MLFTVFLLNLVKTFLRWTFFIDLLLRPIISWETYAIDNATQANFFLGFVYWEYQRFVYVTDALKPDIVNFLYRKNKLVENGKKQDLPVT